MSTGGLASVRACPAAENSEEMIVVGSGDAKKMTNALNRWSRDARVKGASDADAINVEYRHSGDVLTVGS